MKIKKGKTKDKAPKSGKGIKGAILSALGLVGVFFASAGIIAGIASPSRLSSSKSISQIYTIVDSSGGTYFGPVTEMAYEGVGEFQYLSGGFYEGSFSESMRSGDGTFRWPNGDSYVGTWNEDAMLSGTYTFTNGSTFVGTFQNNKLSEGTFDLGTNAMENGLTAFKATYESGKITALEYETADGLKYKGAVDGEANITYENGDTYAGAVKAGVRDGKGIYTWKNESGGTEAKYDGAWVDGVMQGSGIYYYSSASYPYLTGTFVNGKPDGTAVYYKEADNTFDTTWAAGKCSAVKET